MKLTNWLSAVALMLAPVAAQAATISFVQDFNNIDLAFTQYKPPGYTTSLSYSDGSGRAVRFAYNKDGANPSGVRLQAVSPVFLFDPSAQGRIDSIDASIAMTSYLFANGFQVNLATLQNRLRLLAKQDGKVYEAVYDAPGPAGAFGMYRTAAKAGFVANDFLLFDPANPNATRSLPGLNFSGSTIAFGFELVPPGVIYANGTPYDGHSASVTDVNEFTVGVNYTPSVAAVPEPAQWALLIGGFGIVGSAARRRRSLRPATA